MSPENGRDPGAEMMRSYAARFVARITARNRLPLDYSVASLRIVDFLIDGLRRGGAEGEQMRDTMFGLGAYVGEVLTRRAGAVWVDFDADQRAYFGQPVGVRMPDGRVWNPLGKVHNRFDLGGPGESLQTFYLTLHGRAKEGRRVRRASAALAVLLAAALTGFADSTDEEKPVESARRTAHSPLAAPAESRITPEFLARAKEATAGQKGWTFAL
ncbi:hypothetical protein ACI2L1_02285 [Streptomyces sp. NPDC019531]|uniref:hypothetical protein n=1 Tax=Streptomyces sp. NPDC019531 TaxID=3365062 RepID=UPI00384EB857